MSATPLTDAIEALRALVRSCEMDPPPILYGPAYIKAVAVLRAYDDCQRCGEMGVSHAGVPYESQKSLVERLRKALPPADQEWSEIDYLLQEARQALEARGEMRAGHAGYAQELERTQRHIISMQKIIEREESRRGETIELTIQLLREIARRSPEVLRHTDIEAFIEYELEPLKAVRAGHAGSDTPKVKRYNIHAVSISEEPDGEWVRYDDIESKP